MSDLSGSRSPVPPPPPPPTHKYSHRAANALARFAPFFSGSRPPSPQNNSQTDSPQSIKSKSLYVLHLFSHRSHPVQFGRLDTSDSNLTVAQESRRRSPTERASRSRPLISLRSGHTRSSVARRSSKPSASRLTTRRRNSIFAMRLSAMRPPITTRGCRCRTRTN